MQHCTSSHFANMDEEANLNLFNKSYCLPIDYDTKLSDDKDIQKFGKVLIKYCDVNKTDCIDLRNETNKNNFIAEYGNSAFFFDIIYTYSQF